MSKIGTAVIMLKGHPVVPARSVTCLGVNIDCELTFAQHTKRTAANCFYQIRQLWTIRRALSADNARMLVHALVSSRVDYCNSVLHRVAVVHLRPLQSAVNAAARLITKKRKFDPISATLRDELHWLPVRQRIEYKLCLLAFKSQRQLAPSYLSLMCVPVSTDSSRCHLRSASRGDLIIPRTRTASYGPRSFAVSGPTCWNRLPAALKSSSLSPGQFCRQLKTVLFETAYMRAQSS